MISSMTAYSSASYSYKEVIYKVDIRSINSKHLDVFIKSNHSLGVLEKEISKLIQNKISRGRIEVFISLEFSSKLSCTVDHELIQHKINLYKDLKKDIGLSSNEVSERFLTSLFFDKNSLIDSLPNSINPATVKKVVTKSLRSLVEMRREEGASLGADLLKLTDKFESKLNDIELDSNSEAEKRLISSKKKILNLLKEDRVESDVVARKVSQIIARLDLNEEVVRLGSHIGQLRKCFKKRGEGKKMEFILQEMLREINTIGSKSSSYKITKNIIECKTIIEKLREQSFNVE